MRNFDAFGEDLAQRLPYSHHKELAHVNDPSVKASLAARVVEENLTVVQLRTEVSRARRPAHASAAAVQDEPAIRKELRRLDELLGKLHRRPDADFTLSAGWFGPVRGQLQDLITSSTLLLERVDRLRGPSRRAVPT